MLKFRQFRPTKKDVNLGGTADPTRRRGFARAAIAAVLVIGALATSGGVSYVGRAERRSADDRAALRESDAVTAVAATLKRSVDLLYTARSFVRHEGTDPGEEAFERFFDGVDLQKNNIDVYGVGTIARGDDRRCFLDDTAWLDDEPIPAVAFTADLCVAEPIAPALRIAAERNRVTALPRVPWATAKSNSSDFLLLLPVYDTTRVPVTAAERWAETTGWIVAMYRGSVLMQSALGAGGRQFAVRVFGDTASGPLQVGEWVPDGRTAGQWTSHVVRGSGVQWDIRLRAPSIGRRASSLRLTEGIAGSLLTLLVAALLWSLLRGRDRAVALAAVAVRNVGESERRFRSLAASSPVGIVEFDLRNRCVFANARLQEIIGRGTDELSGDGWTAAIHPDDIAEFAAALPPERDDVVVQTRIVRPDGEVRWARMRRKILVGDRGEIRGFVATIEDVTAETWAQDALAHRAMHDALTDLPNRTLLLERLSSALAERDRRGGALAVLFLDIDQFKLVNDSYGHEAGDLLLREIAARLHGHVRASETVARLSGDEFAVLLPRVADTDEAIAAAERIGALLVEPIALADAEAIVTASVGVVVVDAPVVNADAVLRDADTAMYRAKERGRARVEVFHEELRSAARSRLDVSTALRGAIERDELSLHYQPQVDLRTGAVVGAEALVRWNRPGHGVVPPDHFIDVAEDTGLIADLGAWVLRAVLAQIVEWRDTPTIAPTRGGTVSVNVSARELSRPGYVDDLRGALVEHAVPASAFCLEITESAFLEGSRTVGVVRELAALGVRLAIDDFGTGWSSLSRLSDLPVGELKIDRSFVEGLGRNAGDRRITEAVVGLARSLDLVIVAEGVETARQEEVLSSLGCDVGQGFRWSRPLPADDFLRWCEARVAAPVASGV